MLFLTIGAYFFGLMLVVAVLYGIYLLLAFIWEIFFGLHEKSRLPVTAIGSLDFIRLHHV